MISPSLSIAPDALCRPTTLAPAAHAAWAETIEAFLAHARTTPAALGRVLDADPDFAQGHAALGLMLLLLGRGELVGRARGCLADAEAARARRGPSAHEQAYVDALRVWLAGDTAAAASRLDAALEANPSDLLAMKFVQAIRFIMGDATGMLASVARVARHVSDDDPFAGFVHGCHAFALEENGRYAAAEWVGRRAVGLAPRDAWGRHAVAHVMEMTGRAEEGLAWLDAAETWSHCNNFGYHIHWHRALFHLELGQTAEALRLHDAFVRADRTDDYRDVANGASLLARLELAGVDVGDRWEELADIAERRVADRRLVFADLHYLIGLLFAGRERSADALVAHLLDDARRGGSYDAQVAASAGAATALGLVAWRAGEFDEAARLLGATRAARRGIGGSHAQRDVFEQVLIESLLRAGRVAELEPVLRERIARRGGVNAFAAARLARLTKSRGGEARVATLLLADAPAAAGH
jgi:hypothetical protein